MSATPIMQVRQIAKDKRNLWEEIMDFTVQDVVQQTEKAAIDSEKVEEELHEIISPFHGFTENAYDFSD